MTNIFNFRPKKKAPAAEDFLKDADTVEFGPSGRDVSFGSPRDAISESLTSAQFILRDWSNQELASIYRVKKLLDAAGVPNTLDRGISDEGDPWCIFCTTGGDVFIHLARVDGRYVLDSPNLREPLTGVDFTDLIADFSGGSLGPTKGVQKNSARVIRLQRNGKVFLHPAALLAALIWTIYLNSEELVMLAPEEGDGVGDLDGNIALLNDMALEPLAGEEAHAFMDTTALPDQLAPGRLADEAAREAELRDSAVLRDLAGKTAFMAAPTPIAVGLSSIAIAFGLVSEGFLDLSEEAEVAALDLPAVELEMASAEEAREGDAAPRNTGFDLAVILQAAFEHAPDLADAPPSTLAAELAGIDLGNILATVLAAPTDADLPPALAGAVQDSWVDELLEPALYAAHVETAAETSTAESDSTAEGVTKTVVSKKDSDKDTVDVVVASATPEVTEFASLLDFKTAMAGAFKTFDFGGLTVEATFDVASLAPGTSDLLLGNARQPVVETPVSDTISDTLSEADTVDLDLGPMPDPMDGTPVTGFEIIDVNARAFIEFLMSQAKEVEVLALASEIILIDFAAIEAQSTDTYSMSWSLADGGTVSTIGLKTDFQEFDLIA